MKTIEKTSRRNSVPDFWWDFAHNPSAVIVESSDDRNPVVARFPLVDGTSAEPAIERATTLIADLKAGRVTQKQAMLANC